MEYKETINAAHLAYQEGDVDKVHAFRLLFPDGVPDHRGGYLQILQRSTMLPWVFETLQIPFSGALSDDNVYALFLDGKLHSTNGPALRQPGVCCWYRHGKLHRKGQPAVVYTEPDLRQWYLDGELVPGWVKQSRAERFIGQAWSMLIMLLMLIPGGVAPHWYWKENGIMVISTIALVLSVPARTLALRHAEATKSNERWLESRRD